MKIGDKVRVTKGEYKGLVGTVGNIMGEKVRIDNSRVDVFLWFNESDLEPVIEHKFKVGDKVIVNGHNAEITYVTYADNNPYRVRYDNGVMGWYDESELEPISDQKDVDTLLSSVPTMSEDEERLIKNARATFDDSDMKEVNFASGIADNTNQRTASGVDPYTEEIGDPVIKYWYDSGYKDGHDKGYRTGMQAVITNIKRFLKEITP